MGVLLDKVESLAAYSLDKGYKETEDLVQNMRRMTALAHEIVVEFSKVEPSMQIIYDLRDDYLNLEERTIEIVNKYQNDINNTNQNAQQIINNLMEQTDFIRNNINDLLNIGSNFESIASQINVLLKTNEEMVALTEDFINLKASTGTTFIKAGTSTWVEPKDRIAGMLYAEEQTTINTGRNPYTHPVPNPNIADHDGPMVNRFIIAPTDNGIFEVGEPATVASISATIAARSGHSIAKAILFDNDGGVMAVYDWSKNEPKLTSASVSFSITGNLTITTNKRYSLRVFDETGASDLFYTNPMTFVHPFFHGSMPGGTTSVTPDSINDRIRSGHIKKSLLTKQTTMSFVYNFTAAADVLLYPKEYGRLEKLTSVDGEVLDHYTVTEMKFHNTDYYCYLNSGATFSQNNYQLRLKFKDPEIAPPTGYAKIKPLAAGYLKEGTGFTTTGIAVTVESANANIKEIRVFDNKMLVANANHANFGLSNGFRTGTCILTWDASKFAGYQDYDIEVEDVDGRVGKFTSSSIDFINPTYFTFIKANDANQFNLPMTDNSLRTAIHATKDKMEQMFPAPTYMIKEVHGGQSVTGNDRVVHDLIMYPSNYGALTRILNNTIDITSEYKSQRVAIDGVDYWIYVGPAPSPDSSGDIKGTYNRTFMFK